MGFSFASVLLSYFLIAGGTFIAALVAGKVGMRSEYLGYIVLALGGFLGGLVAARASRGSTIIEPALGAVLLIASFIGLGAAVSGGDNMGALLLPQNMKAIALTALASGGGGVAGAFVAEKLFGESEAGSGSWFLYIAIAAFGAGVIGTTFGGVLGKGETVPVLGMLAAATFIVGAASGASASTRPLLASFLGSAVGIGAFLYLTVLIFASFFSKGESTVGSVPSEAYAGMGILAAGAGIASLIGAAIGWGTVGKKNS